MSDDILRRAHQWIASDDTGISSETIWAVMMGVEKNWADIPHDTDDFGRCFRLLKLIPEWRGRLNELSDKYANWKPLVAAWDDLETRYKNNDGTLYRRIKALGG